MILYTWLGIGLALLHTYFLYLVVLRFFVLLHKKTAYISFATAPQQPKLSLILSAYNEEDVLEAKIQNCLTLDYPKDQLEILIGSDGSQDRTAEILAKYQDQIRTFVFAQNRGKAAVLNDLVAHAQGEILVFCDCNTMYLPNALSELVVPFSDPQVGCVNGRLVLLDSGKTLLGEGESMYWKIETAIKSLEADLGRLLGLNGAIYATRKSIFPTLPIGKKLTDDFFVSAKILNAGYRAVFAPQAIGIESTSKEDAGEFHRKVRIGQANFNYLLEFLPLLNPMRPLVAFIFLSHKLLRWFSPVLLIAFFVLTCVLSIVEPQTRVWSLPILGLQCYLYGSAFLTQRNPVWAKRLPAAGMAFYFSSMNAALLIGLFQSLFVKKHHGGWERVARDA